MAKKKNSRNTKEDWRTIGVIGTGPCVGVTHFCILLANYLTGVEGKNTAVLEWNQSGDLERMEAVCTRGIRVDRPYKVLEVSYYKNAGADELAKCLNRDCEKIIVDFGHSSLRGTDLLRCDRKAVMVSLSEWQIGAYLEFLGEGRIKAERGWDYFAVFGSEEARKEVMRTFCIPIRRVPLSEDAFSVNGEIMQFFAQM